MTERKTPIDAALDLFVYLPVGVAITAIEELPKLAAKGRTTLDTQLKMARVVGEFAVGRARQQIESRLAMPPPPRRPTPPATSPPVSAAAPARSSRPSLPLTSGNGAVSPSAELAIPGYDSLSASQVVQRLAGLSRDELAAVAAYEQAHRARRTILNRATQLQGG